MAHTRNPTDPDPQSVTDTTVETDDGAWVSPDVADAMAGKQVVYNITVVTDPDDDSE